MFSYIVVIISFLSRYVNTPDKKKERNINIHLIDFNKTLITNHNSDRIAILNDHHSHFI